MERMEIGQQFAGFVGSPVLVIGNILANFNRQGISTFQGQTKSFITLEVIAKAVALRILADIPSAPVDFVTLSDDKRSNTSSSEQKNSCGNSESIRQPFKLKVFDIIQLLKFLKNCSFKT